MNRVEEKRLIRSAKKGDADAFAALYRANVQKIFRYFRYRVDNTQVAEDLTADVFTRALEGLGRYADRGRPFVAWLYRIAHARVVDFYRKNQRRLAEEDLENAPVAAQPDMDRSLMRQQAAQRLRQAIVELTPDQQQVVILRFIEALPINDVAQIMGKKPNAIKALQHRALRSMAGQLQRSGFDIEDILAGLS